MQTNLWQHITDAPVHGSMSNTVVRQYGSTVGRFLFSKRQAMVELRPEDPPAVFTNCTLIGLPDTPYAVLIKNPARFAMDRVAVDLQGGKQ